MPMFLVSIIRFLRNISKMFPTCYRLVLIWVIILLIFFFPIRQKYFCAISRETFNTIGNKPPICRLLTGLFISSITFYVIWMYFYEYFLPKIYICLLRLHTIPVLSLWAVDIKAVKQSRGKNKKLERYAWIKKIFTR